MAQVDDGTGGITTPDQRLRVFVSSTLTELADERAAVSRAISALGLTPVLFELAARAHPPRELYRAYLAQSQVFVGIYWQRYGWIGPGMEVSGLEDEFRLAHDVPRLLYVKAPAPDREARLTAMIDEIDRVGIDSSYRFFGTARELGHLVRQDLGLLLSERFTAARADGEQPAADRPTARSLPATSTSLIGREHDIDEVEHLLGPAGARLVTLTGPGGVGKTRLAIAVAERLEVGSSSRTVFVPLAPVTEIEDVLPRIAAALGATIEGATTPLDAIVEHLAETSVLLVLDNLEQVAGVAAELDQLLARCPGLAILATSRTVLRLRSEREYAVGALTVPTEAPPLAELAELPAVRLFVDRAQAVRYDFALTDESAPAVLAICRRLDGLPLAIELAAARTRLLDPVSLLARLESSLDALGAGPVDLPERQRTMRATVEWSMGLLDEAERRMLATLSAFADGWTVEAATAVADVGEDVALDLLDALAGHSLLSVEAADAGPRFRMLATVRELAAEQLAAGGEEDEVARRHARFFGALVEDADWPAERQAAWAARLGVEQENVRVAVRWFLTHDVSPLPHMFLILWLYWQMHGGMSEGRGWIDELGPRADELDDRGRAELLLTSAFTAPEVGDDEGALGTLDDLQRLLGELDDPYLQSTAHLAVSWILPLRDDFDGALAAAAAAHEGFRQQDVPLLGFAALTLGMVEAVLGRPDEARAHLAEVDDLGTRFGNDWLEVGARGLLASLDVRAGRVDDAEAGLAAAFGGGRGTDLGTTPLTLALLARAELALAAGDAGQAAMVLGAVEGLRRRAGLRCWPSLRRSEADLSATVEQASAPGAFQAAFAAGVELGRREAVALARGPASEAAAP